MLIGSFNKMRDYAIPPFSYMYDTFIRQLRRIDWLIVSGYSFGDKGVNSQLVRWIDEPRGARMLILHADPDALWQGARGAVQKMWERYGNTRLIVHPHHLKDCDWRPLRREYGIEPA